MPTLMSPSDRTIIIERLRALTPDTTARWGSFDAPRMLCHITDQLRIAVGDIGSNRQDTLLRRTLLKWIVIHSPVKAPPGKVHTVPEMLTSSPGDWNEDMATCLTLIEEVAKGECNSIHPVFGPLTGSEWAKLGWRHLDHHLRQFAV
ncbi:MAG: DUF1569 domain-containing protein [Ignavibacteria bacterium]|nr:DUF1569 domain-containing protein [Ignavibacteria bacterium]